MENLNSEKNNKVSFIAGYLLSAFGYEFIFFVMTVYIFNLTQSAINIGIFTSILAFTKIFLPFSGTITDRFNKEKSFGIALIITGVLVILLFFLNNIYLVYILWFIISFFFTFIVNVRTALMTEIMPAESFLKGNSTVFVALNVAKILAPLTGGLLTSYFETKILFLFTGGIYFIAFFVTRYITLPVEKQQLVKRARAIDQIQEALAFLKNNSELKSLGLLLIARTLFLGFQITLYVTYIKSFLKLGSSEYGIFLTASAMGSIIGSLIAPYILRRANRYAVIVFTLPVHYIAFILLGLNTNYYFALLIIFISSLIFYMSAISIHSIRDSSTARHLRGTVYGTIMALSAPISVVSMIVGGLIINAFGVDKILIFSGTMSIISMVIIGFVFRKKINWIFA